MRSHSLALAAPLSAEDQCVQSMPDASPVKWHLAHTTWFFEALVLGPHCPCYQPYYERFGLLFNSYYESLGPRHPRPQRGLLTRPGLATVLAWREHVDRVMLDYLPEAGAAAASLIELGLQHEQQHQELMLTDILHAFSCNPLRPSYRERVLPPQAPLPLQWLAHAGGEAGLGHEGPGFAFDNERPRHAVLLPPFEIGSRLVTCGEWLAFMADDGYRRPQL